MFMQVSHGLGSTAAPSCIDMPYIIKSLSETHDPSSRLLSIVRLAVSSWRAVLGVQSVQDNKHDAADYSFTQAQSCLVTAAYVTCRRLLKVQKGADP